MRVWKPSDVTDAKRRTMLHQYGTALTLITDDAPHVLILPGQEPQREVKQIRGLWKNAHITALDRDPVAVRKAKEAGVQVALQADVFRKNRSLRKYDLVHLDFCNNISEEIRDCVARFATTHIPLGGVLITAFSYGRESYEKYKDFLMTDDTIESMFSRFSHLDGDFTSATRKLITPSFSESLIGRIAWMCSISPFLKLRSAVQYQGKKTNEAGKLVDSMPMCSLLWERVCSDDGWPHDLTRESSANWKQYKDDDMLVVLESLPSVVRADILGVEDDRPKQEKLRSAAFKASHTRKLNAQRKSTQTIEQLKEEAKKNERTIKRLERKLRTAPFPVLTREQCLERIAKANPDVTVAEDYEGGGFDFNNRLNEHLVAEDGDWTEGDWEDQLGEAWQDEWGDPTLQNLAKLSLENFEIVFEAAHLAASRFGWYEPAAWRLSSLNGEVLVYDFASHPDLLGTKDDWGYLACELDQYAGWFVTVVAIDVSTGRCRARSESPLWKTLKTEGLTREQERDLVYPIVEWAIDDPCPLGREVEDTNRRSFKSIRAAWMARMREFRTQVLREQNRCSLRGSLCWNALRLHWMPIDPLDYPDQRCSFMYLDVPCSSTFTTG